MSSLPRHTLQRFMVAVLFGATMTAAKETAEPLWQSIHDGQSLNRFQQSLDSGADPLLSNSDGDTAMHLAAASPYAGYLQEMLARGIPPDIPNHLTQRTPLFMALLYERENQFSMLLASGANPGRADLMGNTPLHLAAQINAFIRVLDLLEAGAPPKAVNRQGQTFQRYLFMTSDRLLTAKARQARQDVAAWLQGHDIAVDAAYQAP